MGQLIKNYASFIIVKKVVLRVFSHEEQGNAGVAGHGSVVTALSVPRSSRATKNPALRAGLNAK